MKPKTTLKLMKAKKLANTYWKVPAIETIEQREQVYQLLDEAGYYWSSRDSEWVKRTRTAK